MKQLPWMCIVWPSFLVACALEMLVFVVVDPADLRLTSFLRGWSTIAVYSSAFFVFWTLTFASSTLTAWLLEGSKGAEKS